MITQIVYNRELINEYLYNDYNITDSFKEHPDYVYYKNIICKCNRIDII